MWRGLYRWILRRPGALGPGAVAFGYATVVTAVLIVFIAVSAIEIPILHLLLPWETVRVVVDALSFYGLFWMLGLMASLRVHPHVVSDSGLRIRHSITDDFTIGWQDIATIRTHGRALSGRTVQLQPTDTGHVLQLGVLKQTNVDVILRQLVSVRLPRGNELVTELRFYADDEAGLVTRAREHLDRRGDTPRPVTGGATR